MEKKGVGRPRDGNSEETRREILRAADEEFAAAGFVGATTRSVAARAGVNVATLHYHFGSKEGLYRAVLGNAARTSLPEVPPGPAAETVTRLVDALFDAGAGRPTLARLALLDVLTGPEPAGGRRTDGRVSWLREALLPLLGPPDGPAAVRAEDTARAIVLLVDVAFVAAASGSPRPGSEGVVEAPAAPPPLPREDARRAVAAAALRLTGLG